MTNRGPERDRSDEPRGFLDRPIVPQCWFCRAEYPRATTTLGGGTSGGGTTIPCCATGEGCKDGRIFHGPQGEPHYPEEDCPICGPSDRQRAVRRNAGQLSSVPQRARTRSRRPPR
jgi:hypothetical protein